QYGFLLGEKVDQVKNIISDSQIHTSDISSSFCISSFLPWPSNEPLYSRSGCLNEECVDKLLAATEQNVVGWYSFRHQSVLRPSLREITLHDNLASSRKFDGRPEDFSFLLCTSSSSSNMSTFSCNHVFMQLKEGNFKEMPMTVLNLGDTTRNEYRKQSSAILSHCSSVDETLQKARRRFIQPTGEMDQVIRVSHLASSLNKDLEVVQSKLTQSEGVLGLLEAEVDTLRARLRSLEQEESREQLASNAERRRKQEEREKIEEDKAAEAEEKAEMEKLLKDLGLTQSQKAGGSVLEASGATSSKSSDTDLPASHLEEKTTSNKDQPYPVDIEEIECDVEESNGSDSDDLLSVNKVNRQKTYSQKEPTRHEKDADPFDFLATENEKEKEKLLKPNELSAKKVPKSNLGKFDAIRFAGLSNSSKPNGPVANANGNDMLNNKVQDSNSSDEDASPSSSGIHDEDESTEAEQDHLTNINGSHPHNETYMISSSPSF
ncbi:hypothetical protein EGW08_021112, partial [Elysia chlorotica]